MESVNLADQTLGQLLELASQRKMIDDFSAQNGYIYLRVGIMEVALSEPGAQAYLRGLIHGHERAFSGQ